MTGYFFTLVTFVVWAVAAAACTTGSKPNGLTSSLASTTTALPSRSESIQRGLDWLQQQPDPDPGGLIELVSILTYVRAATDLGDPDDLAARKRRSMTAAAASLDPQISALARWIGGTDVPKQAPQFLGANSLNKLLGIALWCDVYEPPLGYLAALDAASGGTAVTQVAAAGSTQFLIDNGCVAAQRLAPTRERLRGDLVKLAASGDTDASLSAGALVVTLGGDAELPRHWYDSVQRKQRGDGSWGAGEAVGSTREDWRATAWAIRNLADAELRARRASAPPLLASPTQFERREIGPRPALVVGTLRNDDRQALSRISLQHDDVLAAIPGTEPFGQHNHDEVARDPLSARDKSLLDDQLKVAAASAVRLASLSDVVDDGYVMGSAFIPAAGAHWIRWSLVDQPFEAGRPSMVLLNGSEADADVVGFSYVLRNVGGAPEGFAGSSDVWHRHTGICFANGRVVSSDILSRPDCRVLSLMIAADPGRVSVDLLAGDDIWMLHAWVVPRYPNPGGIFVTNNPNIRCDACPAWLAGGEVL